MRVYEKILFILEEKGPLPIPAICQEVNRVITPPREKPYLPSQIKSIVTRKNDLFRVKGEIISIHPDKYPLSLLATIEGFSGSSYHVRVNFIKKRFTLLEWRNRGNTSPFKDLQIVKLGNLEEFKREIYTMNIWDWESSYSKEDGIILEGNFWSVTLKTKGKVYESGGNKCFPANWERFCLTVEKLTGAPFRL